MAAAAERFMVTQLIQTLELARIGTFLGACVAVDIRTVCQALASLPRQAES